MNCRAKDDIVRRALIALLTPEEHQSRREEGNQDLVRTSRRGRRAADAEPIAVQRVPARILIVAQPTSQTLNVCWSDPQTGHYAEQLWRKGIARRASFCVLTGMRICPGDAVFRPLDREVYSPANREYMLLAAAVPEEASLAI